MNNWNYLKGLYNERDRFYPTCPYCGNNLDVVTKSLKIEFRTPKIPPIGTKELNLFNIEHKIYFKEYVVCGKCGAKYDYDSSPHIGSLKALTYIPSSSTMLNNILDKELPKYPRNITYKVIWRKTCRKKIKIKNFSCSIFAPFNKLIDLFL